MMRILIAEDEVHLAEAVSQILKKEQLLRGHGPRRQIRIGLCAERHLRPVTTRHHDAGDGRDHRPEETSQ